MSLEVSSQLPARAERDEVDEAEFVDTVRASPPYTYRMIEDPALRLAATTAPFADNTAAPTSGPKAASTPSCRPGSKVCRAGSRRRARSCA